MTITAAILTEIRRVGSTRESIAAACARGINAEFDRAEACGVSMHAYPDWPRINRALRCYYRQSGIDYIKRRTGRLFREAA